MFNESNNILSNVSPFFDTNFKVSELLENCSPRGTSPPLWESSPSASPRHRCVCTTCSSCLASDVASCRRWTNWRCCSRSAATRADVSGSPTVLVRLPRCSPTYCWATTRAFDDHECSESRGDVCDDTYNLLESDGHDSDDALPVVCRQSKINITVYYLVQKIITMSIMSHRNCSVLLIIQKFAQFYSITDMHIAIGYDSVIIVIPIRNSDGPL